MQYRKTQSDKLAPDIINGIIQYIEEQPITNTNWIESVTTSSDNTWTVTIKPKSSYYPNTIIKYVQKYKSLILKGKLFEIENTLTDL